MSRGYEQLPRNCALCVDQRFVLHRNHAICRFPQPWSCIMSQGHVSRTVDKYLNRWQTIGCVYMNPGALLPSCHSQTPLPPCTITVAPLRWATTFERYLSRVMPPWVPLWAKTHILAAQQISCNCSGLGFASRSCRRDRSTSVTLPLRL